MPTAAERIQGFRRRISRMLRRAETRPEKAPVVLREEAGDLLQDLRRLARPEPAVVLDVLFILLDRLGATSERFLDSTGFVPGLLQEIAGRIHAVLAREASSAEPRVDRPRAVDRLFRMWADDADGIYRDFERVLRELAVAAPSDGCLVVDLLRRQVKTLPLVFPPPRGASDDLRRALLLAERHRFERLLGEILAARNDHEYAIIVARDHLRRTGDACDLVVSLKRAGRTEEAAVAARRALASPRSYQRQRLQELLDELLADAPPNTERSRRRGLEEAFLAAPSHRTWQALRRAVPPDQWPRVSGRLLAHLQKHQKAPTLLFSLWLEEGNVLEADGLAVTQPVDAEVLTHAASRLAADHAAIAAGWHLLAAHRRASQNRPLLYPLIVENLRAVRDLSLRSGQEESYRQALERFCSRYATRSRLITLIRCL